MAWIAFSTAPPPFAYLRTPSPWSTVLALLAVAGASCRPSGESSRRTERRTGAAPPGGQARKGMSRVGGGARDNLAPRQVRRRRKGWRGLLPLLRDDAARRRRRAEMAGNRVALLGSARMGVSCSCECPIMERTTAKCTRNRCPGWAARGQRPIWDTESCGTATRKLRRTPKAVKLAAIRASGPAKRVPDASFAGTSRRSASPLSVLLPPDPSFPLRRLPKIERPCATSSSRRADS
jgi:hypothetical protein